ncbi:uncharacterized protein LOC108029165 [Drosophila biarmipes]|uniref:uncharacterized protein LOC108029165 n=1 Tax=Drosophila biarmipes TaxID=125945 RepID=UPI0007E80076|nr:uncharacterized protein LOC108029165 [Drosophila biarmipes]
MNDKVQKHKDRLKFSSKTWGKEKFKPKKYDKPFVPPVPQATAKPWQHVKNDIIDDSEDRGHLDVDNEDAKKFMQQREQNHRRNIIEANRAQATKWESFDEDQKPTLHSKRSRPKKEKSRLWQCDRSKGEFPTAVENFTFEERNFYRSKITLGIKGMERDVDLRSAIKDLERHPVRLQESTGEGNVPFRKMIDNKRRTSKKKGRNGPNPFRKRNGGQS